MGAEIEGERPTERKQTIRCACGEAVAQIPSTERVVVGSPSTQTRATECPRCGRKTKVRTASR